MADLIGEPGVFQGIPHSVYHGQLTVAPSMSASMAVEILDGCPRTMWKDSYLNPDFERAQKREYDLGTAGHLALLEPDEWADRVVAVEADSYRTNAAKEARETAYANGKTPLLPAHVEAVMGLRKAVLADPVAGPALIGGRSEQTLVWRDRNKPGIFLKCRPDKAPEDWSWLADIKTTTSAHPRALKKKAHDMNWAMQAEWYLDGVEAVTGIRPEHFYFIAVEVAPPHLVTVCRYRPRLGEKPRGLEWAAMMNRKAIDLFASCVEADDWPPYTRSVVELDLPTYAEYQLEERRAEGEFDTAKPDRALLKRAMDFQKPLEIGA